MRYLMSYTFSSHKLRFFSEAADSSGKMFSFSVGYFGLLTHIQEAYMISLNFSDEDIKVFYNVSGITILIPRFNGEWISYC